MIISGSACCQTRGRARPLKNGVDGGRYPPRRSNIFFKRDIPQGDHARCSSDLHKNRKSPKRQFGDRSSAFYTIKRAPLQKANPLHGSVGIVQVHSIYGTTGIQKVEQQINSSNLNDPQTAVWGIREALKGRCVLERT